MIKTTLCEVANAAIKTKSQFKGKYQSLVIRRGHKRSLIAIAHKLIRVIYTLLKKRQPYIDPDTDYEGLMVRKNASRWLNKLEEYGYLEQLQQQSSPELVVNTIVPCSVQGGFLRPEFGYFHGKNFQVTALACCP